MKKIFAAILVGGAILSTLNGGNIVYANNMKNEVVVYNAEARNSLSADSIFDTKEDKVVIIQNSKAFMEENEDLLDEMKIPYMIPEEHNSEEIKEQFSHTVVVVKDGKVHLKQLNETVVNLEAEEVEQVTQSLGRSDIRVEDEINNLDNLKRYAQEFADSLEELDAQSRGTTRASDRFKYSDYVYGDCTNAGVTRYIRLCDVNTLYLLSSKAYNSGGYNVGVEVKSEITPMSDYVFVTKYYGEEMRPTSSTMELDIASPQTDKTVNTGSSISVSIAYPYSIGTSFEIATKPDTRFYAGSSGDNYEIYYERKGELASGNFLLNYALGYFTPTRKITTKAIHTVGYGVDGRTYASGYSDLTPYRLNWSF